MTGVGIAIFGATPIGAGIGMTIAVGTFVGFGNELLRDNFKFVRDFEDSIGDAVVSSWNNFTSSISGHIVEVFG